ncbi:MAG TPA: hypothetical protein VNO34_04665 [Actinomycetota bacterium]|nr:hypothetical protein [Actinomycetota bacterium]
MAIYRPRPRRWPLALGTAVLGLGVGFGLGWGLRGSGGPDLAEAARRLQSSLAGAAGTLEVVEVEYRESVRDGQVVSEPEYGGARDALARSRERYLEAREALLVLAPDAVRRADELFDDLERLVADRAPPEELAGTARELARVLREAVGAVRPT